jgi:hypothetical protein
MSTREKVKAGGGLAVRSGIRAGKIATNHSRVALQRGGTVNDWTTPPAPPFSQARSV